MANSETPAMDINVDTRRGVVTLFGIVPSEATKDAAAAEARKVSGVKDVRNELQVVVDLERRLVERADAEIQSDVEARLDAVEGATIAIEVNNGVVRLTGTVDSHLDRFTAMRIARATGGVRAIVDDLQVEN